MAVFNKQKDRVFLYFISLKIMCLHYFSLQLYLWRELEQWGLIDPKYSICLLMGFGKQIKCTFLNV